MVRGEWEAREKTIQFLTGALIGCHCLSGNDDKLRACPGPTHMDLHPRRASQRNQAVWPAGHRAVTAASAWGLQEIDFPNKRPDIFLTLSQGSQCG